LFLSDPRNVEPAAIEKLDAFVRSGGGLWIAVGPHTDEKLFNEHWYRGGLWSGSVAIDGAHRDANDHEKFFKVRAPSDSHPATALLSDFQRLDLDRARIFRRHQFDMASGKDVSVLLEVQHDDPVVVERKLDQGACSCKAFRWDILGHLAALPGLRRDVARMALVSCGAGLAEAEPRRRRSDRRAGDKDAVARSPCRTAARSNCSRSFRGRPAVSATQRRVARRIRAEMTGKRMA
jgi:hypothetical protein